MKNLGETIGSLRKAKGLSRIELCEKLNMLGCPANVNMLGKWERNYSIPNTLQFFALCEVLDIDNINETFQIVPQKDSVPILNEKGMERVKEYIQLLSRDEQFCISSPYQSHS